MDYHNRSFLNSTPRKVFLACCVDENGAALKGILRNVMFLRSFCNVSCGYMYINWKTYWGKKAGVYLVLTAIL